MARRPSILFVNQHYWPDVASTGQHLTDLAEHLVRAGFDVGVLCGQSGYKGQLDAPAHEVHNGVEITRLRTTSFGRARHLGRIVDYGAFYAQVLARLLTGPRVDLVVSLTTPPLLSFAASLAKRARGQRYAIWSMDLHPDAEVALGMLDEGGAAARGLHALNDAGYRGADLVIDLGFRMKERIEAKGVRPERLTTIEVWSDGDEVYPVAPADNPLRRELGLRDDQFVVMYSGNAGLAHRFDEVLETMRRMKDDDRVFFLFVGGGPRKAEIEAFAQSHGLRNFRYANYFPREQLAESLSVGDVHLLTLREAMAGIAVPGKLYGILAAGRPVVMVGPERSEPARTIREAGVGVVVDPAADGGRGGADRLEAALRTLADEPAERRATGERAREVFLKHYDRPILCDAWAEALRAQIPTPVSV
ncbi:glycosyltransferase family 4 protein [Rubrivirga sp. S365]|nr:glycosyltransferase family 4 protein [Rubrivirga sp. S365]MDT7856643.1 glycosyltransferase family 4 protein [Rubrivirga sp. S365]